jgi:23S rRNA (uridine2552-2'-O)-methyltransferase
MNTRLQGKNTWADHYTRKAQKERYPARSVYKLQEIQKRFRVIRQGQRVLDLGCSPGSWLLYAAELTGGKGRVDGVDLKPVTVGLPGHVQAHVADIMEMVEDVPPFLADAYDVVISDMAPATTGVKNVDAVRSVVLCEAALIIAKKMLSPGGTFVCKIFQGGDFQNFLEQVKSVFNKTKVHKPQSSRKASREVYIVAAGKK